MKLAEQFHAQVQSGADPEARPVMHVSQGLFVQRQDDGTVLLELQEEGRTVSIPASQWASLVAFASARGETGETFHEALEFHNRASG